MRFNELHKFGIYKLFGNMLQRQYSMGFSNRLFKTTDRLLHLDHLSETGYIVTTNFILHLRQRLIKITSKCV